MKKALDTTTRKMVGPDEAIRGDSTRYSCPDPRCRKPVRLCFARLKYFRHLVYNSNCQYSVDGESDAQGCWGSRLARFRVLEPTGWKVDVGTSICHDERRLHPTGAVEVDSGVVKFTTVDPDLVSLFAPPEECGMRVRSRTFVYPGETYAFVFSTTHDEDPSTATRHFSLPAVPLGNVSYGNVLMGAVYLQLPTSVDDKWVSAVRRRNFEIAPEPRLRIQANASGKGGATAASEGSANCHALFSIPAGHPVARGHWPVYATFRLEGIRGYSAKASMEHVGSGRSMYVRGRLDIAYQDHSGSLLLVCESLGFSTGDNLEHGRVLERPGSFVDGALRFIYNIGRDDKRRRLQLIVTLHNALLQPWDSEHDKGRKGWVAR